MAGGRKGKVVTGARYAAGMDRWPQLSGRPVTSHRHSITPFSHSATRRHGVRRHSGGRAARRLIRGGPATAEAAATSVCRVSRGQMSVRRVRSEYLWLNLPWRRLRCPLTFRLRAPVSSVYVFTTDERSPVSVLVNYCLRRCRVGRGART